MCSGRPRLLFLVHYNLLDNCILVCRAQQPVNLNPQPRQLHSGALNHPLHMIELGVLRVHIPMPHPLTASSGVQESKFLERPFVRYDFVLLPLYGVRLVTDTLSSRLVFVLTHLDSRDLRTTICTGRQLQPATSNEASFLMLMHPLQAVTGVIRRSRTEMQWQQHHPHELHHKISTHPSAMCSVLMHAKSVKIYGAAVHSCAIRLAVHCRCKAFTANLDSLSVRHFSGIHGHAPSVTK